MNSIVTKRFSQCVEFLKEQGSIRSIRQFSQSLGFQPQSMGEILKLKRDVTLELVRKTIETYNLNPNFLFSGLGEMLSTSIDGGILTVITNNEQEERIAYVPVAAQAGYNDHLSSPIYLEELPTFSLPGYKYQHGTHRCFDVSGDSMEPTLYTSDKVVCSYVDSEMKYRSLRSNQVYIVVTKSEVLIKRVVNSLRINVTLELYSDNNYYEPYIVDGDDVQEVWRVESVISNFVSSPSHERNALHEEIKDMQTKMSDQSSLIRNLNKTIELLIKQTRTTSIS
ncbi:S24 family peptidase [bacterium]|nr:S24 family peptidase [bacterium]